MKSLTGKKSSGRASVIVVGGGPAGMMAALRAAEAGCRVILLEKNPSLGRKLLLTGKGRCNLTNASDLNSFLARFSGGGDFLRDAFKAMFSDDLIAFFADRGLKMKIERQGRVFPVTDRASSVLTVLEQELSRRRVLVIRGKAVKDVLVADQQVQAVTLENGDQLLASAVILATGGMSYPRTGSTGDGLGLAKRLGHTVVDPRPGLVPLETVERFPAQLSGLTLKNIRLTFSDGKHKIVSDMGELLFTGFGVSGPLVISLSGQVDDWLVRGKKVILEIDLKPALSTEELEARFLREFQLNAKKGIENTLKSFLPQRLIEPILALAKIPPREKTALITASQRRHLVTLFKALPLSIKRARPLAEAMVTRGGISLKEIDPRTMQSRLVKGLFFAGEMIDVDGDTGGFNLQAAFSTGFLAGASAAGIKEY